MKRYRVDWAATARDDLDEIITFIAEGSPDRALAALDRIESRVHALVTFPTRGRVVPELRWHAVTTYRELVEPPWRIIYRVDGPRVFVLTVVDARRQLEDHLLARFLR